MSGVTASSGTSAPFPAPTPPAGSEADKPDPGFEDPGFEDRGADGVRPDGVGLGDMGLGDVGLDDMGSPMRLSEEHRPAVLG